ncbi:hypothetical protein RND81_10G056200 [Saponaria officinalis]|uniref:Uncharacterized protein n=1 Tax=Saponaria officinalis TaxID=3572 RepID=A0AAW1I118_SAPOF
MNSNGKNVRGKRALPPPLPMYEPVVLKHVPTMVRRKYDHIDIHDLDSLDTLQNQDIDEGESEDGDEYNSSELGFASEDGDDGDRSDGEHLQAEENGSEDSSNDHVECQHSEERNFTEDCDTEINIESVGNENIQPTDSQLECRESEDHGSKDVNHVPIVDTNLEDEIQDKVLEEFSNEQGSASEDGDDGDLSDGEHSECILDTYVNNEAQENGSEDPINDHGLSETEDTDRQNSHPTIEVDADSSVECQHSGERNSTDNCDTGSYSESVGNENVQPTDSLLECRESKDRGFITVYPVPIVDPNLEDEIQDMKLAEFSNEHDLHPEYSGSEDDGSEVANHAPIVVDCNHEDEIEDKRLTYLTNIHELCSEDTKGEFDEVEDENPTSCANVSIDAEAEETGNKSLDDQQNTPTQMHNDDFGSENSTWNRGDSIGEDDKAEDMTTPTYPTVKEALEMTEKISVDEQEENKSEPDEPEDGNPTLCANASVNSEAEEVQCGSIIDQQDPLTQVYNEDFGPDNFIRNRSLHLTDPKSEGDETKDMNGTVDQHIREATEVQEEAHGHSSKELGFNPEAFKKTVKEDGYELCCPYCKHRITNTLIYQRLANSQHCTTNAVIYQRRENAQHCRITCFTGLMAIFCCIRE